MFQLRSSVLRAIPIPASSYSHAIRNSRSFVTVLHASPSVTSSTRLSRLQRASTILNFLRRTYATEGQSTTENVSREAEEAAEESKNSAETFTDAAKESISSATQTARETVGDALSSAADAVTPQTASSAQTSPIREDRKAKYDAARAKPSGNLYLGNLYFEVGEEELKKEFERFGPVQSVKIIRDGRGLSKGFGYMELSTTESATAAKNALDGQVFEGRRLVVQYAIPRASRDGSSFKPRNPDPNTGYVNAPSKTLFIGNMSYEMSDKDLNELFKDIKDVIDVRVAIDRRTGQPRGFAHADFTETSSAEAAAEYLRTKEFHGRRLRVDFTDKSTSR